MKAEHLTRKTHYIKHTQRPVDMLETAGESALLAAPSCYDLTGADCNHAHTQEMIAAMPGRFTCEDDVLDWALAMMGESPTAARLLRDAQEQNWSFGTTDLNGCGYYLDLEDRVLLLDHFSMLPAALGRSLYFRNAFLTTFVRALRDIWQARRFESFEEEYGPESVVMLERVRMADCDTVALLAGWEWRGAGYADVWRHILGSEEGDMAQVFTRYLERDPTALFDGSALAYAFRQWYADEARVTHCDHGTLEALDDILTHADAHNPFGQKSVTAQAIEALAQLPDGINYLAGLGETIMNDPFFTGMNDPINKTHLFHITYDIQVTMVDNVPFRDAALARKIFPQAEGVRV